MQRLATLESEVSILRHANDQHLNKDVIASNGPPLGHDFYSSGTDSDRLPSHYVLAVADDSRLSSTRITIQRHPLLGISCEEALFLLQRYQYEWGEMFTVVDIDDMRHLATSFYSQEAVSHGSLKWQELTLDQSMQRPLQRLMAVLAVAGVIASPDATGFSSALVDAIEAEIDHRPCGVQGDAHLAEMFFLLVGPPVPCSTVTG